ncbi:MAG TPA: hypothetical protein VG497_08055 [Kribbella sp.]|nr:hypothetical protein [Kribbella sp.]
MWVVAAVLVVAVIVGGGTLYLSRSRRIDLETLSTPEEERRAAREREAADEHEAGAKHDAPGGR